MSEEPKEPRAPPSCPSCARNQSLVNRIIDASVHFLVLLKLKGGRVAAQQYNELYAEASIIFMNHLRDVGLLPKKVINPSENGKNNS